jgi:ribonuclease HI
MTITPTAADTQVLMIATDGSSLGNPGKAAAAAIAEFPGGHTVRWSQPFSRAPNGQMEIEALRMGLSIAMASEHPRILLLTDSKYAETTWNGRLTIWEGQDWRGSKSPLQHVSILRDLRELQLSLTRSGRSLTVEWTEAHLKDDNINNRVDRLANSTSASQKSIYENIEVFSVQQKAGTTSIPIATLDRNQYDAQMKLISLGLAVRQSNGLRHLLPADVTGLL